MNFFQIIKMHKNHNNGNTKNNISTNNNNKKSKEKSKLFCCFSIKKKKVISKVDRSNNTPIRILSHNTNIIKESLNSNNKILYYSKNNINDEKSNKTNINNIEKYEIEKKDKKNETKEEKDEKEIIKFSHRKTYSIDNIISPKISDKNSNINFDEIEINIGNNSKKEHNLNNGNNIEKENNIENDNKKEYNNNNQKINDFGISIIKEKLSKNSKEGNNRHTLNLERNEPSFGKSETYKDGTHTVRNDLPIKDIVLNNNVNISLTNKISNNLEQNILTKLTKKESNNNEIKINEINPEIISKNINIDEYKNEKNDGNKIENMKENNIEEIEEIKIENTETNKIENSEENKIETIEEMKIETTEENKIENTEENKIENTEENKIENIEENQLKNIEENKNENTEENKNENTEDNKIENTEDNKKEITEINKIENKTSNKIENIQNIENTETNKISNISLSQNNQIRENFPISYQKKLIDTEKQNLETETLKSLKLNYINEEESNKNISSNLKENNKISILNNKKENEENINEEDIFEDIDDDLGIEDEHNEGDNKIDEKSSIISSYILSNLKMTFSNDSMSIAPSLIYKSEIQSNSNISTFNKKISIIPPGIDDNEVEITNENEEGFKAFIETPRSSNFNFKKDYSRENSLFKGIYDKIDKKEKEIKKLNDKINQLSLKINGCHEENKKYEKWIEKEESEGELLRHMLNFLTKNQ